VLFQGVCGPLAKLHATLGFDAVADRDDDIEVVMIHIPVDLPLPLLLNYPEFPDSWFFAKFLFSIDVFNVLVDDANIFGEQFSHLALGQPNRVGVE
jgi:hypothetical protein